MDRFGIYIHIPFCKKKCKYCDFVSFFSNEEKIQTYFEKLIEEINSKKIENKNVNTIYIGGGTPSFVNSKYIVEILENINKKFKIDVNAEITLEINPGTITKEKLLHYKKVGINRVSIGLQSTQNRLLELIGRIHNYEDFIRTYNLCREVGIKNINTDLMLALPTQSKEELIESLTNIIKLEPEHISIYSLILEEGTKLQKMIEQNILQIPDEKTERKMYWDTKRILEKNGYNHYEISNFAKKGLESKHNLDCWNQEEYIGFGLAAHSYINSKRISNTTDIEEYIKCKNFNNIIQIHEKQTREEKAKEFMILGLRKIEGVSISDFERKFRINPLFYFRFEINKLTENGLIEVDLDNIKLTKKGLDFANIVFEEFI